MPTKLLISLLFLSSFLFSFKSVAQIDLLPGGDIILQASNDEPDIFFRNSIGTTLSSICIGNESKFNILTGGSSRMSIDINGNVGIGTTQPQQKLHIVGNRLRIASPANAGKFIDFRTDGGALDIASTGGQLFLVGNDEAGVVIQQNPGNVAIGNTTTPDYKLEVVGSAGKPGGGSWSNPSDRRLKKDIRGFEDGLQQILQIRPVWYRYNGLYGLPTEETYVGVIAQEIQEFAPYTITPYTEEDEQGNKEEYLSYDGSAITYMLVNAAQEQQKMMDEKTKQMANLERANEELERRLLKLEKLLLKNENTENIIKENINLTEAKLYQNQPNPFSSSTTIRYFIPETVNKAELLITNSAGKTLKRMTIFTYGEGQVILEADVLSAGTYFYSLMIDEKMTETKQMILTN